MLTRPIPSTKEPLPVIGLGTWQTFDVGNERAALDQRKEVLRVLFEAGGKVIDSSPMYGRAEAVTGSLLSEMGAHEKAFLATKVWTSGEAAGIAQMKASSAKLQSPVIDLMQIHNLLDWRTHLRTLRTWKEQKKFRYIGITHYTDPALDELAAIIRVERIDFVQFGYSIASRAAEARVLPLCAERGVAVIVNQPFDSGSLFGQVRGKALPELASELDCVSWSQVFLKYILGHPAVTCVIPGTAKPEHMRDNVAAGLGRLPDAGERKRMADYWSGL
jgi:diketogulonate reductase-like aldo/keto reductase